ncbi:MAG: redoxin family protein [Planctomycetes bacterium]|nr:redoxin family protein [Planctomycetota bacterium]
MRAILRNAMILGLAAATAVSCKFLAKQIATMYRDAWDNGLTKREGPVEDGLQTGEWTYYYESGQRRSRGRYDDDRRVGPWTTWYESGIVEWRGEFDANGRRTGEWSMNYPDETLRARGSYVDDAEDGGWEFFWPDGTIQRRGWFDHGRLSGLWRYYREDGSLKAEGVCHRGQRIGNWKVVDDSGRAGTKDFGSKPGVAVLDERWPADAGAEPGSRRRVGVLQNDVPVGAWHTFHENGQPRLSCVFDAGKPRGRFAVHDTDGNQVALGTIADGTFAAGSVALTGGSASPLDGPLPAPAPREEWLPENEVTATDAPVVVAALLGESLAPPRADAPPPPADDPAEPELPASTAAAVVAEIEAAPARVPAPRQPWTVTEQEELDSYVTRYLEGVSKARPSRRNYGPSSGGSASKGTGRRRELEGKELPQQVFEAADGTIDLRELRGKKRVLVVILRGFVGEVCVYCVAQTEALAQCRDQLAQLDIEVVVVYPGKRENQESFLQAYELTFGKGAPPYRIYYDEDLEFVKRLGIEGDLASPSTLIVDRDGLVEYAFVGAHKADRPAAKELIKLIEGMKQ